MDKVAFAFEGGYIYWSAVVVALAVLTAALAFLALAASAGIKSRRALLYVLLAVVLSLVFGRLVHWYCRHEQYESFLAAMTGSAGGFSMLGVLAGCAAAGFLAGGRPSRGGTPLRLLDCAAVAGMLGLAVGRLSALFTVGDRGWIIFERDLGLPLSAQVVNSATGAAEPRFATFMFQSGEALIFALVLGLVFFRPPLRPARRDGDTALFALALWGAGELVMDSTRYDALYLRSNGFVSVVQIAAVLCLVFVLAVFSRRSIRARGMSKLNFALWGACLACVGLAGYMEYYVQRHGNAYVFCYLLMSLAMLGFLAVIFALFRRGD